MSGQLSGRTANGEWKLTVEQTGEWVETYLPSIDPAWVGSDRNGHEHQGSDLEATAELMFETCYCEIDNGHPHDIPDHWECRECGVIIHRAEGTRVSHTAHTQDAGQLDTDPVAFVTNLLMLTRNGMSRGGSCA